MSSQQLTLGAQVMASRHDGNGNDLSAAPLEQADPHHGELLSRIYDVAISPERLDELVTYWVQRIEKNGAVHGKSNGKINGQSAQEGQIPPEAIPHFDRAVTVLKASIRESQSESDPVQAWVLQKQHAAFAVNRAGRIVASNPAARTAFGFNERSTLDDITLVGSGLAADLFTLSNDAPKIAWLRGRTDDQIYVAALTSPVVRGSDCIGVTVDFIEWPEEFSILLKSTFSITAAELEVLQVLLRGRSATEVAEQTGRSIATVRTHIASLLSKTQTGSQIELIRLCLGLMNIANRVPSEIIGSRPATPENGWDRKNHYKNLKLSDGRDRAYIETGDPEGEAFLLFPSPLGLFRFPKAVELSLAYENLRMIAPLRASLGPSSLPPDDRAVIDVFVADTIALMDELGIKRAPVVCIGMDLLQGLKLAKAAPDRISAVIGAGAMLPAIEPEHMARLEAMARFFLTNARAAPRITNIMTFAYLYMGYYGGPLLPLKNMLRTSPIDLALLDNPEIRDAMTLGSPTNFIPNFKIHEACCNEVLAFCGDWREELVTCRVPVVLFNGDSSPWNPVATLHDFAARSPNIKPVVLPKTGLMVAHQHPDLIIAEVKKWL